MKTHKRHHTRKDHETSLERKWQRYRKDRTPEHNSELTSFLHSWKEVYGEDAKYKMYRANYEELERSGGR